MRIVDAVVRGSNTACSLIHKSIALHCLSFVLVGFFTSAAWAAAPATPTNLTATAASSRQINLSWQDKATNETNYYVERAPASSGTWTVIATLGANATSYQSIGLTQNTTYYYRVRCKAGTTYSSYSNTASALTATLAAPTALSAAVVSASSISISWADNTAYETLYSIERGGASGGPYSVIGSVATNVTTTTNPGLSVGTAYYYRVRAYDGTNYSAYSNIANQTIRTITSSAGTNGTISPTGTIAVASGANKAFTMTPNGGYKIQTVLVDGASVTTNPTYTFTNVTANHTISATFSANTVTIMATAGANGTISPAGAVIVNIGSSQTFTISPNSNYHVSNVLVDGASVGAVTMYTFPNVAIAHTITASFAINTYPISASAGANGAITPTGVTNVNSGGTATYSITPNASYHISDVLVDGSTVGAVSSYVFSNVTATHTISASFAINTYPITASAGSNGAITPTGVSNINSGGTATYSITPNASYHISDVLVDGSTVGAVSSYVFSNVTSTHTISASFAINSYPITASAGANGAITPTGVFNINSGGTTTYSITPNASYQISDVLVDGSTVGAVSSYVFSNVTATHTISASFVINTYPITASAGANGAITPTGITNVNSGETTTYTIMPNATYHISDVLVDGSTVGAASSYVFSNVTASHTITASFTVNTYTIAANSTAGGTISPSGTATVNYGTNQTYTMTPNAGYSLASVLVDGTDTGIVSSYTFTSISTNHSITAGFADITSPAGSIVINSSAAYTNNPIVFLTLSASDSGSGVSQMQFSNDNIAWTTAEPYATAKSWTLISGDGPKNVYVKYQDVASNWSSACSSTITLDTIPPIVTITSPIAGYTNNKTPMLNYAASDGAVIVKVDNTVVSKASGTTLDQLADGPHVVRVESTDAASNTGSAQVACIVDTVAPITIASPAGGVYNMAQSVTLTTNETATIYYTTDGTTPTTGSNIYAGPIGIFATTTLNYFAVDLAGNNEQPGKSVTYTIDIRPVIVSTSIQNNSVTVPINTLISVEFNEPLASSSVTVSSVFLAIDDGTNQPVPGSATLSADRKTVIFTPSSLLVKGTKYKLTITSSITDDAGNSFIGPYVINFATSNGAKVIQNQGTTTLAGGGYDSISIINSTVTTTGSITAAGTLSMIGSTLITQGTVSANSILLSSGSNLTHAAATTTGTWVLDIFAVTSFTIDPTSKIDVTGKGYQGGYPPVNSTTTGWTIGNTTAGGSATNNGGSYGGLGGILNTHGIVNSAYGDLMNPNELGSGGGSGGTCWYTWYAGGNGGGLIKITAGSLQVDGNILADGGAAPGCNAGGGSGGGVSIHTSNLAGSGMISAKGGAGSDGGSGGGGRIAVYYDVMTLPTTSIIATGGIYGTGGTASYNGGAGTIYLRSSALSHGDLIIDNRNISSKDSSTLQRSIGTGVISALTSNALTDTGATWIVGALKGLIVNPNTAQTVTFIVTDNTATTLYIDPSGGDLTQAAAVGSAYTGVLYFNSVKTQGTSMVRCDEQLVIDSELNIDSSTLVTSNIAADKITLTNGSLLTHGTPTVTAVYSLNLKATTAFIIDASSKIDVTARGYLGGYSGTNSTTTGRTRGNTTAGGSTEANGGSYGGLGGKNYNGSVNAVYGNLMSPNDVGSGGGSGGTCYSQYWAGGNGGGLVTITTGTLQVDGSILADGGAATFCAAGGGSGGGLNILASTLTGTGIISAKGGTGYTNYGGGGGGGRIAIYYIAALTLPTSNILVTGGTGGGSSASNGSAGTVYYRAEGIDQPPVVTILSPVQGRQVVSNASFTVVVQASDDFSIKDLTLTASGEAAFTETRPSLITSNYTGTFSVFVPSTASTGNLIYLTATAKDWTGNTSQTVLTVPVIKIITPPTVNQFTSPTPYAVVQFSGNKDPGTFMMINNRPVTTLDNSTTWQVTYTLASTGDNVLNFVSADNQGNQSQPITVTVNLLPVAISNVGISANVIDTSNSGSSTIFFTMSVPSTVTLKIIPENQGPSGTPIYQAVQTCPSSGAYLFTWDGKNNSGQTVPDDAYLYIIEATNGAITASYSPAAPTGTAGITCTQSQTCDPNRNIPLVLSYTANQPEYVTLGTKWWQNGGHGNIVLLNGVAKNAGQYAYEWDCRDGSGTIIFTPITVICSATLLYDNTIIITGNIPDLTAVTIDPYQMSMSYGQIVRISYNISRDANIQVQLVAPSGTVATILPSQLQTAGSHTVTWNGIYSTSTADMTVITDSPENRFIVSEEGYYKVKVTATNPSTQASSTVQKTLYVAR